MGLSGLTNSGKQGAEGNIVGCKNSLEPRLAIRFRCVEERVACVHEIFIFF
jgi:hypothetical protein